MFNRGTLIQRLTKSIYKEPDLKGQTWDRIFVWVEFETGVQTSSGWWFDGAESSWLVQERRKTMELFKQLRAEIGSADPRGEPDAILFFQRAGQDPVITPLYGAEAQAWHIGPSSSLDVWDKARAL